MSPAFIRGVADQLPQARITFDKFHVVAHASAALDQTRRIEQRRDPGLKGLRWILLKDRQRLSVKARTDLDALISHAATKRTARAWLYREGLRAILDRKQINVVATMLRQRLRSSTLLFILTWLVKPSYVLETGTWLGLSSCAIGRGLKTNGFGHLTTLEINPEAHRVALEHIAHYDLTSVVNAHLISSMEFVPDRTYDMALFESEMILRVHEFRRFRPSLREGALVIFHDTASHHRVVTEGVRSLISEGALVGVDLPTPRGVFLGRVMPAKGYAIEV